VTNPAAYASAVRRNAASAAATQKASSNPGKTFVYTLNLEGGKKYTGMTSNPQARIEQHFTGAGAAATKAHAPVSVNHIQACHSAANAKKAEKIVHGNMAAYHGSANCRGAGHTSSVGF
jgi:predicted GIY-YIG superfamily endonuclease